MSYELIYVHYQNNYFGSVDEVTLDDLIKRGKIKEFYRPSQKKWVDVNAEPVRLHHWRLNPVMRRASDSSQLGKYEYRILEEPTQQPQSKVYKQKVLLTSQDWFEYGCECTLAEDYNGALRSYAKSIQLDPANKQAYTNRAILCEQAGNYNQAIDDYCAAISLDPQDARLYYLCGLARRNLDQKEKAMEDFERSAQLGYVPAITEKCKTIMGQPGS